MSQANGFGETFDCEKGVEGAAIVRRRPVSIVMSIMSLLLKIERLLVRS